MICSISKTDQLKKIILQEIKQGVYRPGDKLPSIQTICKRYNVSKHTVSQTISTLDELGILNVAHGKRTRVAQSMHRKTLEIIYTGSAPLEQQEFWSEFYRGIKDVINENENCSFRLIFNEELLKNKELEKQHMASSSGALVLGTTNPELFDLISKYSIPHVMVYDSPGDMPAVTVDFRNAYTKIIEQLVRKGKKRPAFIGPFAVPHPHYGTNTEKFFNLQASLTQAGMKLEDKLKVHAWHKMSDGYEAAQKILSSSDNPPDCIFLSSDILAPGVYRALHEHNLSIPDDVAVIGCDNLEISKYLVPALTTLELSRYEIGKRATRKLIALLNGQPENTTELVSSLIIERESI